MTYVEVLKGNEKDFPAREIKRLEKIFQIMDEKNVSLETLSQREYAKIIVAGWETITLGIYPIRGAYNGLRILYDLLNISLPEDIKNMTMNSLLDCICQIKQEWSFFKTIEDVIAHVDKLNWGDFSADAKVVYVLAWHGINIEEMSDIKKSDFDFEKRTLKITDHNLILFSDFEISVIKEYSDLAYFRTPNQGRINYLVHSDYLFRPCVLQSNKSKTSEKTTATGLRTKLKKVNDGLIEKKLNPRLVVKNLITNGDFYRVYTMGLSKHIFDINRRVQYEQYVKAYWEE